MKFIIKKLNLKKRWWIIAIALLGLISILLIYGIVYISKKYVGEEQWVYVDRDYNEAEFRDSLISRLGQPFGEKVYDLWNIMGGELSSSCGAYKIDSGLSVIDVCHKILNNHQTPVKVVFNNVRTMEQLAKKVSKNMRFSDVDFLRACDSILLSEGFVKEEFPVIFFPDSYEFYWTTSAESVVKKMLAHYCNYWSADRREKAKSMGLSPAEVSVVASIVEEETNKKDERPLVARLYLNRIKQGMKLQADPTVKFALGDFSLRRITLKHLYVESPYNTYINKGLPPGPIRIVNKATLDDVLNAPEHKYIYMCAKEDFSGYHNFAEDYATHRSNARRYQAELNRRNIK